MGPSKRSCIASPATVETWLIGYISRFQRFFQRLLQPSAAIGEVRTELGPVQIKGAKTMFSKSSHPDHLACAFGALVFAGLSFGAALFPLIVA